MGVRRLLGSIFGILAIMGFFLPSLITHFPAEYYNPNSPMYAGIESRSNSYILFWADNLFISSAFIMAVASLLLATLGYSKLLLWTGLGLLLTNFTGVGWLLSFAESIGFSSSNNPLASVQFLPLQIITVAALGLIIIGITAYAKNLARFFARNKDS